MSQCVCRVGSDAEVMICTLILQEGKATVPLPARAVAELGLRPGQYVRIEVQPLAATPMLESDGTLPY